MLALLALCASLASLYIQPRALSAIGLGGIEISSTVFFHIGSARTKLSLVDKLCRLKVTQGEWKHLQQEVQSYIDIRNGMAHFEIQLVDRPLSSGTTLLAPHHLDTRAGKGGTVEGLYADELVQAADEFLTCSKDVMRFAIKHVPDWQRNVEQPPKGLQRGLETIRSETSSTTQPDPSGSSSE